MKPIPTITTVTIAGLILAGVIWLHEGSGASGKLVFTIETTQSEEVTPEDVQATISSISLYSEASGWETVSRPDATVSLPAEGDTTPTALLDKLTLSTGAYSQARLGFSEVVTLNADDGETQATLATDEITLPAAGQINRGSTSSLSLTLQMDTSLHKADEGGYQFLPVVEATAREQTEVATDENDLVRISGGTLTAKTTVAVNANGESVMGTNPLQQNTPSAATSSADQLTDATTSTSSE